MGRRLELGLRRASGSHSGSSKASRCIVADEGPDRGIDRVRRPRRPVDPGPEVDLDGRVEIASIERLDLVVPDRPQVVRRAAVQRTAWRRQDERRDRLRLGERRLDRDPRPHRRSDDVGPTDSELARGARADRRAGTTARSAAGFRRSHAGRIGRRGGQPRRPATGDPTSADRRRRRGRGRAARRSPRSRMRGRSPSGRSRLNRTSRQYAQRPR